MDEDLVYIGAKSLLQSQKWILLGGQPPDGCDHLPVIEIKPAIREAKGSYNVFKPDLVAYRKGKFLIVECKPLENQNDVNKLEIILADQDRLLNLFLEMEQRHIFERKGIDIDWRTFRENVSGAIAHGGPPRPLENLFVLYISENFGESVIINPLKHQP